MPLSPTFHQGHCHPFDEENRFAVAAGRSSAASA